MHRNHTPDNNFNQNLCSEPTHTSYIRDNMSSEKLCGNNFHKSKYPDILNSIIKSGKEISL